jgi:DNA polymerase-4
MIASLNQPTAVEPATRVVAHVDLDAFFTSVEQLLNPRLAGQPVVVGGAADQRGVVAAASYEARARGVFVPMPLTRAYRVCPDAHFLPGRHALYGEYSRRVFAIIERECPLVEKASIDEGYLDWTVHQWMALHPGLAPPVHWPLALADRLRRAILGETGLSVSIGVGANHLVAKIAGKYCKPKGICHIAAGTEAGFLRPMRLGVVPGIGRRAVEVLAGNGFERFADVQDASDATLRARLGRGWADRLRAISRGVGRSQLVFPTEPKSISNERTFARDCRDHAEVRRTLYRLVERAVWRLRRAELCAGTVGVKLRTADFRTRTHERSLGIPSDARREIYLVAARLLDERMPARAALRLVGVRLGHLRPAHQRQLLLFNDAGDVADQRVDEVLDGVRGRFGYDRIGTAAALPSKAEVR